MPKLNLFIIFRRLQEIKLLDSYGLHLSCLFDFNAGENDQRILKIFTSVKD